MTDKTKAAARGALRSKTMWLSAFTAAVGALQAQTQLLTEYLTPSQLGLAIMGLSMLYAALRAVTDTALTEK